MLLLVFVLLPLTCPPAVLSDKQAPATDEQPFGELIRSFVLSLSLCTQGQCARLPVLLCLTKQLVSGAMFTLMYLLSQCVCAAPAAVRLSFAALDCTDK